MEDNQKKSSKKGGLITGMIVGGAVGSVLSLLFSSKKGKHYTKSILQKTESKAGSFFNKYRKNKKQ